MIHTLMQTDADLPALPPAAWLTQPERERLAALQIPKRRQEWLLGRWTAKRLAQGYLLELEGQAPELYELGVSAGPSGAPELRLERPARRVELRELHLSISHS